ncbi:alpha/beta hydrolase [Roseovarius sp. HI0049]|nr:alpha/beta hydrolase [Roseovarius sp. HI0049]
MTWWAVNAIVAAVAIWPFAIEALRPRMTRTRREVAPGQVTTLSQGVTHYQWFGPEKGPVAVCVHGLTTPSFVWGPVAEELVDMGYRVLTYDLYGRGFSDRPRGAQDSAFFLRQLDDLLEDQGVGGEITLIGYSMGGAIAASFAAEQAGRLRQLVLLAPAGLGHDLGPVADMAVKYNFLGRWMMLGFYAKSLRRATEAERGLPSRIDRMVDLQIAETRLKGFAPAVLSSLRGILDEDLEGAHRAIADAGLPVLAIWGEKDDIIPLTCKDTLADWNPQAKQEVIPDAGHALTYTHAEAVMAAMRKVL